MPLESKVKIGEDEGYIIGFPVGDWAREGHGKYDYYLALSNQPLNVVREAHLRSDDVLGFNISSLCDDQGGSRLKSTIVEELKELKYDFDKLEQFDEVEDDEFPFNLETQDVFDIWIFLLNKIDPSLNLKKLNLPVISFYGLDEKNRSLIPPGYGCFD